MIIDITLNVDKYILIIIYNGNTEILDELQSLLKKLDISQKERIIFTGDFNIFFNWKLEAKSGKQLLKRKSIAKLF